MVVLENPHGTTLTFLCDSASLFPMQIAQQDCPNQNCGRPTRLSGPSYPLNLPEPEELEVPLNFPEPEEPEF